MAAYSVTGVSGPGLSFGMWKPESNTGCNCGKGTPAIPSTPSKTVCATRLRVGNKSSLRTGGNIGIKTCS